MTYDPLKVPPTVKPSITASQDKKKSIVSAKLAGGHDLRHKSRRVSSQNTHEIAYFPAVLQHRYWQQWPHT